MSDNIEVSVDGGVLSLVIARPEKKNALSGAMYDAMTAALAQASGDDAISVVLISGKGGVFTAGNDLADFLAASRDLQAMPAGRFVHAIAAFDKPLVAAVDGAAVGVGTTMCLHCDLVYAAPGARFQMPFVNLGLVPEAASSLLAPRRFGHARAAEYLMLGEAFDAATAHQLGLVNAVVAADQLFAHAMSKARALAAKPREALFATRRLLRGDRADVEARMREEEKAFAHALQSPEARAAFTAFLNKSKT
jgi:enoyl-CoA hydratase/carnithine racemase